MSGGLGSIVKLLAELRTLPCVEVQMWGGAEARELFKYFTKRHRYLVVRNKEWGVGLLDAPATFEEYLKGKDRQALRTNRNHALAAGFSYHTFSPQDLIDDIMEVNASAAVRQGQAISRNYLDRNKVLAFFADIPQIHGVFDGDGKLRAYAHAPICGDVCVFSRLLGHAEDLHHGIMYLMVSEVVRWGISQRREQGVPKWVMYDTFFGASDGLRYFKERTGFRPHRVRWRWLDR